MVILGMHHTAISTHDIDRLASFYINHFHLKKLDEAEWANAPDLDAIVGLPESAARYMLLSAGNQCLELFEFRNPVTEKGAADRPVSKAGFTHICFAVRDIGAEYERLRAAGMLFHTPPVVPGDLPFRATYGRDPDGNVVELIEIGAEHPFAYRPTTPNWLPEELAI